MEVCVCIASVGRTSLIEAIDSILNQLVPESVNIRIVVADDSHDGDIGVMLRPRFYDDNRIEIHRAGARNIAAARNVCLEHVGDASFVGFIDDDELAEPDWLQGLVDVADLEKADVVFGPVEPIFLADCPAWASNSDVFRKRPAAFGPRVQTGSTCNALLRWTSATRSRRFDVSLGVTGGEDTQFFSELHRSGLRLIATDRGVVRERVPGVRLDLQSLRARYIRGGQSTARMIKSGASRADWIRFSLRVSFKLVVFSALAACRFPLEKGRQVKLLTRYWGAIGESRQVLGIAMRPFYTS